MEIDYLILIVSIVGATGSIYNAFFIQRPWLKMFLEDRKKDKQ